MRSIRYGTIHHGTDNITYNRQPSDEPGTAGHLLCIACVRLRDIPSQTRLIAFEGIENVEDLANYTDAELDTLADRNSKRSPAAHRVQMGLTRTKALKAITHWVRKKLRQGVNCDLHELTPAMIAQLITEINAASSGKRDADSKLYYPDSFVASDFKNWIKKVEN